MLIREIYELAVRKGMEADFRGEDRLKKFLEGKKEEYNNLQDNEKWEYDQEKFNNPYDDTRILFAEDNKEIGCILTGIDMEVGEILLAERLKEKGKAIDLIISHHPEGKALAALSEVMHLQEDILRVMGVPINVAEGMLADRIAEVARRLMPVNHNRAVDAARILGIPMMCVHTPADNLVTKYLSDLFAARKPETVGEVVQILKEIPEYKKAVAIKTGPQIVVGNKNRRAGKIFVDMTGGTEGPKEVHEKLSIAGVGTVVCMHMTDEHRKIAEKNYINVINAGHMSSDSIGMNLFLDELEQRGVEVIPCSGLTRVKRWK